MQSDFPIEHSKWNHVPTEEIQKDDHFPIIFSDRSYIRILFEFWGE